MVGGEFFQYRQRLELLFFQYKRQILAAAACMAGLLVLIISYLVAPKPEAYADAERFVMEWISKGDEVSYVEMRKALKRVPALERKYGAAIAQKLFQKDRLSDALALAHRSLKLIEEDAPFHAAYGETTLLIEQGSYQDALERSVGLKEKMSQEKDLGAQIGDQPAGGTLLFVHNLVRIACLQKELENRPGERAAWDELENFLKEKEILAHIVYSSFRDKGLDLSHYISERKKAL